MPAEWTPHECCWMAWPRDGATWPLPMTDVYQHFARLLLTIAQFEPVRLLVDPADRQIVRRYIPDEIEILEVPLDDSWMRDIGPTFVFDDKKQLHGVDWQFNGWGKYPYQKDQFVARRVLEYLAIPRIEADWVNEGGAIHVDGQGTCLLTETVQLNANRNPNLDLAGVEQRLAASIGAQHCIWLPRGLEDDDTDGHVDELACFVAPGKVLAATAQIEDDNHAILQANLELLSLMRDAAGQPLSIRTIELPPARWIGDLRLSQSYVNFYIANGAVIAPAYGDARADARALDVLQSCFVDRPVVQVDCSVLVSGGGNIHCLTQQQPAV